MTAFSLPAYPKALVFDIDSTLYTHPAYAQAQNRVQIGRLAALRGWSPERADEELERVRGEWAAAHGGARTSLGNAFKLLGIEIEESVRWRQELLEPADYLRPDPRLGATLAVLASRFRLACLTNNPVSVGKKTLAALGVEERIGLIVGLDTTGRSKPEREPFLAVLDALGLAAEDCVSVGDRYDVDIAAAVELGMGGILVSGVEEVYALPEFFSGRVDG